MDKYLLEILKEVNTIIIPGLGALTITNAATGEIMFMPYLKHDDGKLAAHIAQKEGMDENEARNLIAKYVREITSKLDQGDSYDMFQFGSFVKDGDDLEFKRWEGGEGQATPEASATEATETEVEEPKTEEATPPEPEAAPEAVVPTPEPETPKAEEEHPEEEPLPEAEVKEEVPTEEPAPVEEAPEAPQEETKETPPPIIPITEAAATESKPATTEKAPVKEMNILQKEEMAATEKKLSDLKKAKEKPTAKKKRGVGFWLLMVLIVLIVAGGTLIGIFYDDVKQHIPFLADTEETTEESSEIEKMEEALGLNEEEATSDETATEDEQAEEETSSEDTIEESEQPQETTQTPEPEHTPEPVATMSSGDGAFHLIAGAFSSEANANRLAEKLRAEGYSPKVGMGAGMHLVSVKSYPTREAAIAGKSEVSSVAPKAWVYEWR